MELADVQIQKVGTVIKVTTPIIHAQEPSVPTDFVDYMSTTSIFTFANEQGLVNQEIHKASPIARYLTVTEAILLGLSVFAFIYLGVVMFKPDWF